ncbi:MAG TPA: glycosyltransferase family 4 protein [Anaeromyxobacter sp.]
MRILVVSNVFPPGFIGGYELAALDVARGLIARGHEVHVLTSDYFLDDHGVLSGPKVSRSLRCASLSHEVSSTDQVKHLYYSFHNVRALGSAVRQFRPDAVLAFNLHGLGVHSILQYLQAIGMPTVLYLMDNVFTGLDRTSGLHQQYESLFGPLELGRKTRLIGMSENVIRETFGVLGKQPEDVTYVPGWVEFDERRPADIAVSSSDGVRFVFSSRVAGHKGIDIIVDAVERLTCEGLRGFTVDVYGAGQVAAFMQRVTAKNLTSFLSYKGLVSKDEMLEVLSRYDALLFPTWEREAFGFVASEAAVAGCFPILTAGIGASEWFLDGTDCFKISRNVDGLASAMRQVLHWSDDERRNRRLAAMHTGRRSFSFERWLPVIEGLCLEEVRKASPRDLGAVTRGAEAALLVLSSLFNERAQGRG